jgi:hypothetical protein
MKPLKGGGYERLAFKGNTVVEAKNMKTGATHTAEEFARDRKGQSAIGHMMRKHKKK